MATNITEITERYAVVYLSDGERKRKEKRREERKREDKFHDRFDNIPRE